MKAEIKTKEKGFEPIELNITIESSYELSILLDVAGEFPNEIGAELWELLEKIRKDYLKD